MFHKKIKSLFYSAVDSVVSDISRYTINPDKDLTRCRKLPPDRLISFLVSEGASGTKNELLDFFGFDTQTPSASAFNQQRAKLKPEAVETVFKQFNRLTTFYKKTSDYDFIAVDGSSFTFFSKPLFASKDYCSVLSKNIVDKRKKI